MVNIVDSIGFDLERVHTGLIVYLVGLWQIGDETPLLSFLGALGVRDLRGHKEIKAKKEYKNIDLVLCGQDDEVFVAIEMKVHNHESLVTSEGSDSAKSYQTEEYPKRVHDCRFLYITLGLGEYYRREPHGDDVHHVGLHAFHAAVEGAAHNNPILKAWEETLDAEQAFRKACREGRESGIVDAKKWNAYFLGFLRYDLESLVSDVQGADLTVYRHSSDTILNLGLRRPRGNETAHCYMEMNQNGMLNLKAALAPLGSQTEKRAYVRRVREHYEGLTPDSLKSEQKNDVKILKKSKTIMSFDVGIEKRGKFLFHKDKEGTCKQISDVMHWFSETPCAKVNWLTS
ncbi:hypothetical protein GBA65_00630 [Rubrobacter marinus]|uniref:PD-(D/E)XK nuclease superfamily protein n=1 Tax=Rubrobacter marinus TaxID=2653852 RepID=A0A6G8PTH8_9ACTN|nr:hypothetical protein [Rubrobacter marinus]QIN77266.1 hypothetical protein GBA65_00630 [Rubrobacter marinus]